MNHQPGVATSSSLRLGRFIPLGSENLESAGAVVNMLLLGIAWFAINQPETNQSTWFESYLGSSLDLEGLMISFDALFNIYFRAWEATPSNNTMDGFSGGRGECIGVNKSITCTHPKKHMSSWDKKASLVISPDLFPMACLLFLSFLVGLGMMGGHHLCPSSLTAKRGLASNLCPLRHIFKKCFFSPNINLDSVQVRDTVCFFCGFFNGGYPPPIHVGFYCRKTGEPVWG